MMIINRCYSELVKLPTFEERYDYLKLDGEVGLETFGYDRYLNQVLYRSEEWKRFRRSIIIRDGGCDLGVEGFDIRFGITIHHLNPLTKQQILNRDPCIFNPENVITTQHKTHMAIHYGSKDLLYHELSARRPNDMCPWKH